jgi:hypothetical protein
MDLQSQFGEKQVKDLMRNFSLTPNLTPSLSFSSNAYQLYQLYNSLKRTESPMGFRNLFHPVQTGYSLYSAAEILAKEPHLHRIPVVDPQRKLVNIITQSMLIKFITKNMELLGQKREIQLRQITTLFHRVHSVRDSEHAVEAFKIMCNEVQPLHLFINCLSVFLYVGCDGCGGDGRKWKIDRKYFDERFEID